MGRASNRKKAQRQAGQKPQVDAATQQALLTLAAGLQALSDENKARDEGVAAASRAWCGGTEPVPADGRPAIGGVECGQRVWRREKLRSVERARNGGT